MRRPWILVPVLPVMLVIALIASSAQFVWGALKHLAHIDRETRQSGYEW